MEREAHVGQNDVVAGDFPPCSIRTANQEDAMIIDAYNHIFPQDLVDAVLEVNPSSDIAGLLAQTPHMYDVELRLAYLDQ
jgi:hypothetical protein